MGDIVFCLLIALLILGLARNELVFRFRIKALKITSERAKNDIDNNLGLNWESHYNHYESFGSYDHMMLSITKWKFKDFYPGLE